MPPDEAAFLTFGKTQRPLMTLFHDISALGCPCAAWSQRRPAGKAAYALEELSSLLERYKNEAGAGIVLIGHSRGGVIARKYAESTPHNILGIVTLGSPHGGSTMALWAHRISMITSLISPFFDNAQKNTFANTIKMVLGLWESEAIVELMPGSALIGSLEATPRREFLTLTLGGTRPELFSLYSVRPDARGMAVYKKRFSVPAVFSDILPDGLIPDEITNGMGDGLVSERNTHIPYEDRHLAYYLNHIEMLFDDRARGDVLEALSVFFH